MNTKKQVRNIFYLYIAFSLFWSVISFPRQKQIFDTFENENQYQKIKVLVDSIVKDKIILVNSSSDLDTYEVYYSNPEGQLSINDNTYYFLRRKKEKSNIEQLLKSLGRSNDSIYIWHHPVSKDIFAKETDIEFSDTFDWFQIILNSILFTTSLFTICYLLFKYFIVKKLKNKN